MIALWVGLALGSPCDLTAAPDAALHEAAPRDASRVHVIVELWTEGASAEWIEQVTTTIETSGHRAVLVLSEADYSRPEVLAAIAAGHEVALAIAPVGETDLARIRRHARIATRALGVRPRVAVVALPRRSDEAILALAGYSALLERSASASAVPRRGATYDGQIKRSVVVPPGPYHGRCGPDPVVGPFSPRAADRATVAVKNAAAAGFGVVRVALDGARGASADSLVLSRWLALVEPAGATVSTATEVALAFRATPRDLLAIASGRFVPVTDVVTAAYALRDAKVIPRSLPGELTPTEAWVAFAHVLAGDATGDLVLLEPMAGPTIAARTTLGQPTSVPTDQVAATARSVLSALPSEIPSALPVAGRTLTSAELLLLFASAVRGDDPPTTRPIGHPDPFAPGLGWGASGEHPTAPGR